MLARPNASRPPGGDAASAALSRARRWLRNRPRSTLASQSTADWPNVWIAKSDHLAGPHAVSEQDLARRRQVTMNKDADQARRAFRAGLAAEDARRTPRCAST